MGDTEDPGYSIIEYFASERSGYRCGYCKSEDTNFSNGMWSHKLSVQDYQDLINRGWRRSGSYCYKPTMNKTCCPQYTIKCDALNFKLSKSQKKVLKRMHSYLSYGNIKKIESSIEVDPSNISEFEPQVLSSCCNEKDVPTLTDPIGDLQERREDFKASGAEQLSPKLCSVVTKQENRFKVNLDPCVFPVTPSKKEAIQVKPGQGRDPTKPAMKKAKLLRREKQTAKSFSQNNDPEVATGSTTTSTANQPKSLEDFLNAPIPDNPAHKLELRLVEVNKLNPMFSKTFKLSCGVFRCYQMTIHEDPPDECEETSFKNFLVDGPLTPWKSPTSGPPCGYGPFHQQYWLDGQLIAVGVLDILPSCVSSVYFYYDPKFSFLSLGTYASLREIALTREMNRSAPDLRWYYMGFYIHSCPKMRYKGNCTPSFLLCPETYKWIPIEKCIQLLDTCKYSKFSNDSTSEEELDINKVLCLYNGRLCTYGKLRRIRERDDENEVREFLNLTGAKAGYSLLLYRQ